MTDERIGRHSPTTDHLRSWLEQLEALADDRGVRFDRDDYSKIRQVLDKTPEIRKPETDRIKERIARKDYWVPSPDLCCALLRNCAATDDSRLRMLTGNQRSVSDVVSILRRLPRGEGYGQLFHKLGSLCVPAIFEQDLSSPIVEVLGSDGSHRIDLVLYNQAVTGFWGEMKEKHGVMYVCFEFKNWKKEDHIRFGGQISRYGRKNRGVVLVVRDQPSSKLLHECYELYSNSEQCLPLAISSEDIWLASKLKDQGLSPNTIFEQAYSRLQVS